MLKKKHNRPDPNNDYGKFMTLNLVCCSHDFFIRRQLRTRCAFVKEQQIELPISLFTLTPISRLPSDMNTRVSTLIQIRALNVTQIKCKIKRNIDPSTKWKLSMESK